jgi:hypothetical protein
VGGRTLGTAGGMAASTVPHVWSAVEPAVAVRVSQHYGMISSKNCLKICRRKCRSICAWHLVDRMGSGLATPMLVNTLDGTVCSFSRSQTGCSPVTNRSGFPTFRVWMQRPGDRAAGDAGVWCRVRARKVGGRSRVVSGRHPVSAPSEGDPTRGVRRSPHRRAYTASNWSLNRP